MCDSDSKTDSSSGDFVVFENVSSSYAVDDDLTVDFVLGPYTRGSSRDWLGIYEQGWRALETPLAFEWGLGFPRNNCGSRRRIVFKRKYFENAQLNKKYQFVYINEYLQVLGESLFFEFVAKRNNQDGKRNMLLLPDKDYFPHSPNRMNSGETTLPDKKAPPSCKFDRLTAPDKIFTTCVNCIHIFIGSQIEQQRNSMFDRCSPSNMVDAFKETKIGCPLEFHGNVEHDQYCTCHREDEKAQIIVTKIIDSNNNNGNNVMKSIALKVPNIQRYDINFNSDDFTQRELFLKAIIGRQELQIHHLTCLLYQKNCEAETKQNVVLKDVVTLFKTDEKMMADVCSLSNDSSEESFNEEED